MKSVWKFPLEVDCVQSIAMPFDAEILCVQAQYGRLVLWAIVEPDSAKEQRRIVVAGTGQELPNFKGRYIGTVQMMEGQLIWHVFEMA